MKSLLLLVVAMALMLTACQRESTPEASDTTPSSAQPLEAGENLPEPMPESAPEEATHEAQFDGYGKLKLGMTDEQVRVAWGNELNSSTPSEPGGCTLLTPKWATEKADVAFMIEGAKFVRYDVTTGKAVAPGGGRVGMNETALKALYPGLSESPHKYVEGAKYLSLPAPAPVGTKLRFETDAAGRVITWRVGLLPQVDYVEGCS